MNVTTQRFRTSDELPERCRSLTISMAAVLQQVDEDVDVGGGLFLAPNEPGEADPGTAAATVVFYQEPSTDALLAHAAFLTANRVTRSIWSPCPWPRRSHLSASRSCFARYDKWYGEL
jgi:hypothetical protein